MLYLGLKEDDHEIATHWQEAFRNNQIRDPDFPFDGKDSYWSQLPPFCPVDTLVQIKDSNKQKKVKGCFSRSMVESEKGVKLEESHPFVRGFKNRYPGKEGKRLLEYIRVQFEEYQNSQPPTGGFQRVFTKCAFREC